MNDFYLEKTNTALALRHARNNKSNQPAPKAD